MKIALPKGLILLSLIIIVTPLTSVRFIARSDGHMIFFGQVLLGLPFKIYYLTLSVAYIIIGIGLLLRRKWSYFCFLALSVYGALLSITNIIVTSNDTLMRTGWKLAGNNLKSFRIIQTGVICVIVLMALWLYRYRSEFAHGYDNRDMSRSAYKSGS